VPIDFHPANDVEWIDPGPGLRFEGRGIAFGEQPLRWKSTGAAGALSVELWVVPADEPDDRIGQIFCLFDGAPVEPLQIAQWKTGLVVRNRVTTAAGKVRYRELGTLGLLFRGQRHYIAVTSDAARTSIYLDGRETEHRSSIPVVAAGEKFGGRLVLGNSPAGTEPWKGDLLGVAVYERALGADEIARHDASVAEAGVAVLANEEGLVALYPFDERSGNAARSRALAGPPLRVPLDFRRLRTPILQRPTLASSSADFYGRDPLLNIIGFVPLGFFAAVVARRRGVAAGAPAAARAIVLGFALSLGIEIVQVHLPARVSSATDVACNTLGSALGAWLALRGPIAARIFKS
jgi:hypothetical protein